DFNDARRETIDRHLGIAGVGLEHNMIPPQVENSTLLRRDPIESDRSRPSTLDTSVNEVSEVYAVAKRIADITVATILLILILPFIAIIALAIKMTSPGAVIFRQVRVGKNMQLFTCYKFRSMVSDAEWILDQNADLKAIHSANWKLDIDPRITPFGGFIRKASLDELPQLINVIKGDMSIVGPRPVQLAEMEERYGRYASAVTAVRPGITGLWQVSGRSSLTYEQRIELDIDYMANRSLLFDLTILVKTVPCLILRHGAH
ncbi:MAG: sugar transferase, partial [Thermomicrobiales bacterium]